MAISRSLCPALCIFFRVTRVRSLNTEFLEKKGKLSMTTLARFHNSKMSLMKLGKMFNFQTTVNNVANPFKVVQFAADANKAVPRIRTRSEIV